MCGAVCLGWAMQISRPVCICGQGPTFVWARSGPSKQEEPGGAGTAVRGCLWGREGGAAAVQLGGAHSPSAVFSWASVCVSTFNSLTTVPPPPSLPPTLPPLCFPITHPLPAKLHGPRPKRLSEKMIFQLKNEFGQPLSDPANAIFSKIGNSETCPDGQ